MNSYHATKGMEQTGQHRAGKPILPNGPQTDRGMLTNEIEAAFRERRAPCFPLGNSAQWSAAVNHLLTHGRLAPVVHVAPQLVTAFPSSRHIRNLFQVLERMPPVDERALPFQDLPNEVQIVRRDNSDTVMLVFCGRGHQAGFPLCLLHRWLGRLPVSLVYLRDSRELLYLAGIRSLGHDRASTLACLRGIISSLGAQRTVCYGSSGGLFAALHYGLDLGSDAVLGQSGITNVSPAFNRHLRSATFVAQLGRELPHAGVDLREAYSNAKRAPRVRIVYAENNWDDRLYAEYLSSLPTVTLQAVPDTIEHNVITDLVRRGEYESQLEWLVNT
jgi:hypothetical protein